MAVRPPYELLSLPNYQTLKPSLSRTIKPTFALPN